MEKKKLTKADIIDSLRAKKDYLSRDEIHNIIDDLFEELKAALAEGKTIELRGFGTFEIRKRSGRMNAHNPKTGEKVSVSSHSIVYFKPGKEIQETVWGI